MPLPLTTSKLGPLLGPTTMLETRTIVKGSTLIPRVLIQWKGCSTTETTWEDVAEIQASYPQFNLEDKVPFKGEGNVMNLPGNGRAESTKERENEKLVTNGPRNVCVRKGSRVCLANSMLRGFCVKSWLLKGREG